MKGVMGGTGLVERFDGRRELNVSLGEETFRAAEKEDTDCILLICGAMYGGGVLSVLGVGGGGERRVDFCTPTSGWDIYSEHLELSVSTGRRLLWSGRSPWRKQADISLTWLIER